MLAVTEEVFKFGSVPEAAIRIAESAIALLQSHSAQASCLKEQGLKIGERLAQVEAVLGKAEFTRWLKHHFAPPIVRYFRNLTKQAQLIEKYPELRSRILSLPLCHSAALMAGTEQQIEEILTAEAKWTVALIKEKLQPKKITPGAIASDADWKIVKAIFRIGDTDIESLKEQASIRAAVAPISTDHILEVLTDFGYDTAKVRALPKQPKFTATQVQQQVQAALEFATPELSDPKLVELVKALRDRTSLQQEFNNCVVESSAKEHLRQQLNQTKRKVAAIASELFIDESPLEPKAEELQSEPNTSGSDLETIRTQIEAEVSAKYENSVAELVTKVQQLEAELAANLKQKSSENSAASTNSTVENLRTPVNAIATSTEKGKIEINSVVRVMGGGRGDYKGRMGRVDRFEKVVSITGSSGEAAIVAFDEGTRHKTEVPIYNPQQNLAYINISPEEVERISIGFHSARELKELRAEKESLKQVYSGEAIAIDLGKALTPAIGKEKVQQMIASGKNGLSALGRYLYELIVEYSTVF
ncbi:hypothetical protein [Kamptonema sp. UHCC 0994]|uniref:hypothetical protein n=1 Tax=Kamptonema sp. UHCC 0994 TaxID=3031329 RepID=UPI0023B991C3|nr:hypothetical protein [Kamptonema sp. UHCC 0994]MDF0555276.1 hypothetical protein [Kamptonema sp. UHCC 0994]